MCIFVVVAAAVVVFIPFLSVVPVMLLRFGFPLNVIVATVGVFGAGIAQWLERRTRD